MNFIKSTLRNRLGTDISAACIQLKSTNYNPRIDSLARKMQQRQQQILVYEYIIELIFVIIKNMCLN